MRVCLCASANGRVCPYMCICIYIVCVSDVIMWQGKETGLAVQLITRRYASVYSGYRLVLFLVVGKLADS